MVMNHILMVIILMIGIAITSCTNTPPRIPTPPTPMVMINDRAIVIDSLTILNAYNSDMIEFMFRSQDVYKFDDHPHMEAYVSSRIILSGLALYKRGIKQWDPPENKHLDILLEIKEAELYRIEHFTELSEDMQTALLSNDMQQIEQYRLEFKEWRDHPDNKKSMMLQARLLKQLNIEADEVGFQYDIPTELPKEFQSIKPRM